MAEAQCSTGVRAFASIGGGPDPNKVRILPGTTHGGAMDTLDTAIAIAQGKVPGYSSHVVKDDPDAQKMVGEAEMRWRSARAFLHDTVDGLVEALAGQENSPAAGLSPCGALRNVRHPLACASLAS